MILARSHQHGRKNSVIYFKFEQLSIILVVTPSLIVHKYTAAGVLSFSIHHFMFKNIVGQSEHNFASEHLRRNKK